MWYSETDLVREVVSLLDTVPLERRGPVWLGHQEMSVVVVMNLE